MAEERALRALAERVDSGGLATWKVEGDFYLE